MSLRASIPAPTPGPNAHLRQGDEEAADEEEMARLRELVEEYVHSNEPSPRLALPNMTLTRIHEAFGVLREMARQGGSGAAAGAAGEADKPARSDSEVGPQPVTRRPHWPLHHALPPRSSSFPAGGGEQAAQTAAAAAGQRDQDSR